MTAVEVRAFRGTRRSAIYRTHTLESADFCRIRDAARSLDLPLIGSLDPRRLDRLDKDAATRVAEEMTQLRLSGQLLELDDDLAAIASLARWCRHSGSAWMTIEPSG
jgi:hypothetical protein